MAKGTTNALKSIAVEDRMIALLDSKRIIGELWPDLMQAWEAKDFKKMQQIAGNTEKARVTLAYFDAISEGDSKQQEYYGSIIRDFTWERPKASLQLEGMGLKFEFTEDGTEEEDPVGTHPK